MKQGFFYYILGLGGLALDPPDGAAQIVQRVRRLGVSAPNPFTMDELQNVTDLINATPKDAVVFLAGDSCGANRLTIVATASRRIIAKAFFIQASIYCNSGCPGIPMNVNEATIWYSSWWKTWGLGVYRPQLAPGNTTTKRREIYDPHIHPDDNDPVIQSAIDADIKRLMA